WLGRGLQSLAHQFDSGRRLYVQRIELEPPGEILDALHRANAVESPQVDLGRADLRMAHQPLERLKLSRMTLQEVHRERRPARMRSCLNSGPLGQLLNR